MRVCRCSQTNQSLYLSQRLQESGSLFSWPPTMHPSMRTNGQQTGARVFSNIFLPWQFFRHVPDDVIGRTRYVTRCNAPGLGAVGKRQKPSRTQCKKCNVRLGWEGALILSGQTAYLKHQRAYPLSYNGYLSSAILIQFKPRVGKQ